MNGKKKESVAVSHRQGKRLFSKLLSTRAFFFPPFLFLLRRSLDALKKRIGQNTLGANVVSFPSMHYGIFYYRS